MTTATEEAIAANLAEVRARIAAAAARAGRSPADVSLVAVSKTMPIDAVRAAFAAGQRLFGENRVQEAEEKVALWLEHWPADVIDWHLIGHLQTNKVKSVVGRFSLIHSVDSLRLAEAIDRQATALGVIQPVLLEVHLSEEPSKSGFPPAGAPGAVAALRARSGVRVDGLMTIAPLDAPGEAARPYFRALRQLRDELRAAAPSLALPHLSMGMSGDFETAIEEGATLVRVGRAIFGERR